MYLAALVYSVVMINKDYPQGSYLIGRHRGYLATLFFIFEYQKKFCNILISLVSLMPLALTYKNCFPSGDKS